MDDKEKDQVEVLADFGEDFGTLTRENISSIFEDIHASISPLDPLSKSFE